MGTPLTYTSALSRVRALGKKRQLAQELSALTRDLGIAQRREQFETKDAPRVAALVADLILIEKQLPKAERLAAEGDVRAKYCVESAAQLKTEVERQVKNYLLSTGDADLAKLGFRRWAIQVLRRAQTAANRPGGAARRATSPGSGVRQAVRR